MLFIIFANWAEQIEEKEIETKSVFYSLAKSSVFDALNCFLRKSFTFSLMTNSSTFYLNLSRGLKVEKFLEKKLLMNVFIYYFSSNQSKSANAVSWIESNVELNTNKTS